MKNPSKGARKARVMELLQILDRNKHVVGDICRHCRLCGYCSAEPPTTK
ncbi:MAG: hypothetical protein ACXW5U_09885 [Thermoanaerobaculia bacterium]